MVSRETLVTVGALVLTIAVWYALRTATDAPRWVLWAVVLGGGIVLPRLLRRQV